MWLEGDGDCFRANDPRAAHDFTENMRMRPMDAIEVADAHDGASEVGRYVIELVEDIHSKSLTAKFAKASQRTQRTSLRASGNSLRSLRSRIYFLGTAKSKFQTPASSRHTTIARRAAALRSSARAANRDRYE